MAMQEYKVKAPDGQIIKVRGPAGASQQEVIAQAQRLMAQRQPQQPAHVSQPAAPTQETPKEPSMMDRLGSLFTGSDRETRATQELPEIGSSGILAGLDIPIGQAAALSAAISTMTNPEEIAQTLKAVSPDIGIQYDEKGNILALNNKTGARAVINKPGVSALDIGQAATAMAAFAPAGRAATAVGGGALRQAAALGLGSAATQAAIEAGQQAVGGEFNTEDVALSGALGAAAPLVAGGIGRAVDVGRNLIRGTPGAQQEIVQAAQQAKIPLMTTDVAEPTTFVGKSARAVGERIPLAGTGGLRSAQQESRQKAIQELGEAFPEPKPDAVISSLKAQTSRIKQAAGQRYETLVPKVDAVGPVNYTNTATAIDDALAELSRPGIATSDDALKELAAIRGTLSQADQTYSTLQANRTALREAIDSYDGAARSQMPSRAKSLLNKVYASMSKDMDEAAKNALTPQEFSKLKAAQAVWADEAQKLTRTRLKSVLDKGDLTPEVAETLIFSKKPSEVRNLYQSLDTNGRQAVRATVIQKAIKDAGGIDAVSPDKFLQSINKMQTQVGTLFKGDEKKQLTGLIKVLDATRRAGQAGVQTATGQELYAPIGAAAAGSFFGDFGATIAAGGTAGALARIYESAPIRNLLLRIGSAPNSDAAKNLALQLARDLNAGMQSVRAQSPAE